MVSHLWRTLAIGWILGIAVSISDAAVSEKEAARTTAFRAPTTLAGAIDNDGLLANPPGVSVEYSHFELSLFERAAEGRIGWRWLFDAALIASGQHDADECRRYQKLFDERVEELSESGNVDGDDRSRAAAILAFLHSRIFSAGYRLESSDPGSALEFGWYNCVSASVLFNCFAERFGLQAAAVEVPGHTFSVVLLSDEQLAVEATCRRWFELGDDPQRRRELVEQALGCDPHSNSGTEGRRELSAAGLVALVYYNRGVDLIAQRRFAEAAACNIKAIRLDPGNQTARGNLLAAINNWSLELSNQGAYDRAVKLLRHGLSVSPAHEPFQINFVAVHQTWVHRLTRAGRYDAALRLLRQGLREMPRERYFELAPVAIYQTWSGRLREQGRLAEARSVLEEARVHYPGRREFATGQADFASRSAARLAP